MVDSNFSKITFVPEIKIKTPNQVQFPKYDRLPQLLFNDEVVDNVITVVCIWFVNFCKNDVQVVIDIFFHARFL